MNKIELARKQLQVKTMDHQVASLEFRILELGEEIARIEESKAACHKKKEELEQELKQHQGG